MPRRQLAFLVLLNLVFIVVLLVRRMEEHVERAWSLELVGRCYVDYHVSIQAVGLSRGGLYSSLVLPVRQSWQETPDSAPEG